MNRKLRISLIVAGTLLSLVCIVALVSYHLVQTEWFKNKIRDGIISVAQDTTGGRVELGSFDYDWHTLSADFHHFVIHGTEPAGAEPLFQASSIHVQVKIISVFKKNVDLVSLILVQPRIYVLFRSDGTTNLPSPKTRPRDKPLADQLLALRVQHFEIDQGQFTTDVERIPLNARCDNLQVIVNYQALHPAYNIELSSRQLHVASKYSLPVAGDLDAQIQFSKDRLSFSDLKIAFEHSHISANATLEHFTHPEIDVQVKSSVSAGEVARIFNIRNLTKGDLDITGSAHYDPAKPLTFTGKVTGHNVAYESRIFTVTRASLQADVHADLHNLLLQHLSGEALGSQIGGTLTLHEYRHLTVDGTIQGLKASQVSAFLIPQPLPWSGAAEGPFHIEGTVSRSSKDFIIQSSVIVSPTFEAIPVAGTIDLTYMQADNILEFGNSRLTLPHSQLLASGILNKDLEVTVDSTNLSDLTPALLLARRSSQIPVALQGGSAHFKGSVVGPLTSPSIDGNVELTNFKFGPELWDRLHSHVTVSSNSLDFSSLSLAQGVFHISGGGHFGLTQWLVTNQSPLRIQGQFSKAEIAKLLPEYLGLQLPIARGVAGGSVNISGTVLDPSGSADVAIDSLDAYGEQLNHISATAKFGGDQVQVAEGRVQAGPATLTFSGAYKHSASSWRDGQATLQLDSAGFPLASLSTVRRYDPSLGALVEVHAKLAARISPDAISPTDINGTAAFKRVTRGNITYGNALLEAVTHGQAVDTKLSGDLHGTQLNGSATIRLIPGYPAEGQLQLARIDLETIAALVHSTGGSPLPVQGSLEGGVTFNGPLQHLDQIHASARVDKVQLIPKTADNFVLRNLAPVIVDAADGVINVRDCQLGGNDTSFSIKGSIPYSRPGPIDLRADGSLDLRLFQLADSNLQSTGKSTVAASITGTIKDPLVNGTLELKNASFFLNDLPNGLSGVDGTLKFDRNRATIQKLTAHSGGGDLSLNGFVAFGGRGPLVYQLAANANNVRVRYAGGISVTFDSDLKFTGASESSLLSGTVTVGKASFTPSTDIGGLLATSTTPAASPTNANDFLHGVQLDIRVESAPNLQLSTTLSQDVESEIDLSLRGTPDRPDVLGRISVNQGDIKVFGTKYTINRGEISFFNPAKIEPVLDLDLQTQARGITVDITVSGTLSKLNINYRSDPPLQPRDIVALLTVGRTPETLSRVGNTQVTNDSSALQSGANTVLGQAISPVSNRLSRLFGITNIKIDPLVQGITNTPQARLTLEQQISRDITVTYITNLSQTSEQIFRLEWALNRQYSLVALRDDNGEFGIDILFRKRFK